MCENLPISGVTGKIVKGDEDSAIKKHLLFWNQPSEFEDFSVHTTNQIDFKITLMENLLIKRDQPPLDKSKQFVPPELLDC